MTTSKLPASVGRPRVDSKVEELVLRMARENRSWGYDRIQGSVNHLGYKISDQTVGNILKRHGIAPAPERKKTITWRDFTQSHLDILLATDFFNSDVWNWFGLMVFYLLKVFHFALHPVQSVRRVRYQPMQTIRALVNRVLNSIDDRPDGRICLDNDLKQDELAIEFCRGKSGLSLSPLMPDRCARKTPVR